MRSACQSLLIYTGILLAFSIPVDGDGATPRHIHLSLDGSLNTVVAWSTANSTARSIVRFGCNDTLLDHSATGTSFKFVDGGKKRRSQFMHRVTLTGLSPATTYYYRCGDGAQWSDVKRMRSVRRDSTWSPTMAVFGDMGLVNAQSIGRLTNATRNAQFDLILHVGDFAYDMATNDSQVGDDFMQMIEPVASALPYMTCPGNHEHLYNFANYKARFAMPNGHKMYYSFNIGKAHIISISTEYYYFVYYGLSHIWKQYRWLERDLREAAKPENRQKRPWIITVGHRPMYCSTKDGDDCTHYKRDMIRVGLPLVHWFGLEKLFHEHGVDVCIWAHEHIYERLWPVYNLRVYNGSYEQPYTNPDAPVHVITGSAGCQERHDEFVEAPPAWSAFRSRDYGFSQLTVHNATHLSLRQISDDQHGKVIDDITVVKTHHGAYTPKPCPV